MRVRTQATAWLLAGATALASGVARAQDADPADFYVAADYEPVRDPAKDLAAAVQRAKTEHKRILLEVGGEWCVWCHILDAYVAEQEPVRALVEQNFLIVKVNFSQENMNAEFLRAYPTIEAYPHLFVLESDGTLLHSQDTGPLESGRSYDLDTMLEFLRAWAPRRGGAP